MNKERCLELIKLLSAIESWSFAKDRGMLPDYLHERLCELLEVLAKEVLAARLEPSNVKVTGVPTTDATKGDGQ